jgi:hypothetical protein
MTSTGTIYTPTLIVNGTTASTDYLTGALTSRGVGIAGNLGLME